MSAIKPPKTPLAMPYVFGIPRPPDPAAQTQPPIGSAPSEPQRGGIDARDFDETYHNAEAYRVQELIDAARGDAAREAIEAFLAEQNVETDIEWRRAKRLAALAQTNTSAGHQEMLLGAAEGAVAAVITVIAAYGFYRVGKAIIQSPKWSSTNGKIHTVAPHER